MCIRDSTYTNNIESFINSMIKKFPNIKISLYLNIEKNFKDFIHINNIFNKLMYISNIDNISLYQTELTEKIIIINKDLANTFSLNTLFKYNNICLLYTSIYTSPMIIFFKRY